MSDKVEKVVVLPGNTTAWKPCNKGEVLTFTHHDVVLPFSAYLNPFCLKQNIFTKFSTRSLYIAAKCVQTLESKVLKKQEIIFYNKMECSIVGISPDTKKMKMLQSHEPGEQYKGLMTVPIDIGLFQLATDSTCQVLIPDFRTRKFTIEKRSPVPFSALWEEATLVAVPGCKVMVTGCKWDN